MEIITIKKHVSEKDARNDDDIYHGSPDADITDHLMPNS